MKTFAIFFVMFLLLVPRPSFSLFVIPTVPEKCEKDWDCRFLVCNEGIGKDTPICCNNKCVCGGVEDKKLPQTCQDKIDNDCNGFADADDPKCSIIASYASTVLSSIGKLITIVKNVVLSLIAQISKILSR